MKIVIPISDFFLNEKQKAILLQKGDIFEIRDRNIPIPKIDEYFYHSLINILKPIDKQTKDYLIEKSKYNIINFSCHLLTSYKEYDIVKYEGCEIVKPKSESFSIDECIENANNNINILKEIFGDIEISLENTGYINDNNDFTKSPIFITYIVDKTKTTFLFDIAHALVSQYNTNDNGYINKLPLKYVNYIHLSKYKIKNGVAYDAHRSFNKPYLTKCLNILNDVKYINIEYYKDFKKYIKLLDMLENEINERNH